LKKYIIIICLLFVGSYSIETEANVKSLSQIKKTLSDLQKYTLYAQVAVQIIQAPLYACGCPGTPFFMSACANALAAQCLGVPIGVFCLILCQGGNYLFITQIALGAISLIINNLFKEKITVPKPEINPVPESCDNKQGTDYDKCKCENIDGGIYIPIVASVLASTNFMCFLDGQDCELIRGYNDIQFSKCVCTSNNWTWDDTNNKCLEGGPEQEFPEIEIGDFLASNFNIDSDLAEGSENLEAGSLKKESSSQSSSSSSSGSLSLKSSKYRDEKEKDANTNAASLSPSSNLSLSKARSGNNKKQNFNASFLKAQARKDIMKEADDLFEMVSKRYINYQLTMDMIQK